MQINLISKVFLHFWKYLKAAFIDICSLKEETDKHEVWCLTLQWFYVVTRKEILIIAASWKSDLQQTDQQRKTHTKDLKLFKYYEDICDSKKQNPEKYFCFSS